jgi:cytochrome c oxidase subunit 4
MSTAGSRRPSPFATHAKHLLLAWSALLLLMLISLGSAYLNLGTGNAVAGIAIAAVKAAIVAWWFMQLRLESALVRSAALVGLFMLALLATLSGIDYSTRLSEVASVQAPQQLKPLLQNVTPPRGQP